MITKQHMQYEINKEMSQGDINPYGEHEIRIALLQELYTKYFQKKGNGTESFREGA